MEKKQRLNVHDVSLEGKRAGLGLMVKAIKEIPGTMTVVDADGKKTHKPSPDEHAWPTVDVRRISYVVGEGL